MMSTLTATTNDTTTTVRIKTLDAPKLRDEQKDLEQDFESEEEPATNEEPVQSEEQDESEIASFSGLSSRASDIKTYLQQESSVQAIVLKHDGSTQAVSYDSSSAGTRRILSGKPSVVGEIEELNLIVLQSLEISKNDSLNQHTLPVPLCHHHAHGDYVLFRVDAEGNAGDISLEEYQKYVEDHKTLTETAIKNYNNDEEPIRSHSPFHGFSDQTVESLRGALETQIWDDIHVTELSDAEIQKSVKRGLQKYVDEVVAKMTATPMEDPDYVPENDEEQNGLQQEQNEQTQPMHTFQGESVDNRPWRHQLKDALVHVQQIGQSDGAAFAEIVLTTFEELNGEAPALSEVADLYSRIRTDFANEAEEELEDDESLDESEGESEDESEDEDDSEVDTASESEMESVVESEVEEIDGEQWEEALDIVRALAKQDGESLVEDLVDSLYEINGQIPSLEEVTDIWQGVQEQLLEEADEESDEGSDEEEDDEHDYDPDNLDDQYLAEQDLVEDFIHESTYFEEADYSDASEDDLQMEEALDHIRAIAREDGQALAQNIFDFLCEENEEEPSLEEVAEVWELIQDELVEEFEAQQAMDDSEDDSEDSEDDMSPIEALQFSAKTVASDWVSRATNLYLNQKGREPTEEELLDTIREFAAELADTVLKGVQSQSDDDSDLDSEQESEAEIESESEIESEIESELDSEEEVDGDDWEEALEVARTLGQQDGEMLAEEICEILEAEYGEEPSLEELTELWVGIQEQLVEEAEEGADDDSDYDPDNLDDQYLAEQDFADTQQYEFNHFEAEVFEESEDQSESEEEAEDGAYDPDNMMDHVQARWDLEATIKFESEHFDHSLLNTPVVESKTGNGVSWNVYFNEADLTQQGECENLKAAADSFRIFHNEAPTVSDLKHLAEFLAVPNELDYEEESDEPVAEMESVIKATKVLVTPVAEKKAGKRFNVYLGESKIPQKESEQIAIKWLKRFNGGQEPSEEDLTKIQAFIQKDAELTEQEFLVPVKKLQFEDQEDDQKSEEEEDQDQEQDDEDMIDIE